MYDPIYFFLFYAYFLLFIAPFHLVAWTIRYFNRKGKDAKYVESLMTYIQSVGIYLVGYVSIVPAVVALDLNWIGSLYLGLAGGFPIYYWVKIFYPSFKKKRLNYDY